MTDLLSTAPAVAVASDHARLSCRTPAAHKGMRYPADPPTIEEIVAVMRAAGDNAHGRRLRALIVVLWRADCEFTRPSRSPSRTSTGTAVRSLSAGARAVGRREVGMHVWAWVQLEPGAAFGSSSQSDRCCVSSTSRLAAGRGRRPLRERSCGELRPRLACNVCSLRISFAMRTPSRWPTRACRSS